MLTVDNFAGMDRHKFYAAIKTPPGENLAGFVFSLHGGNDMLWDVFISELWDTVKRAAYASLIAFIAYIVNHYAIPVPVPTPDDLNIVGAVPAATAQAVEGAATVATAKTAISIPLILFLIDMAWKLFGGKFTIVK